MRKLFKTSFFPILLGLFFCFNLLTCNSEFELEPEVFHNRFVEDIHRIHLKISRFKAFPLSEDSPDNLALKYIDSLYNTSGEEERDFRYFLELQKRNVLRLSYTDKSNLEFFLDLVSQPEFNERHILNRSLVHFKLAKNLKIFSEYTAAVNHLNQAAVLLESTTENYNYFLADIYNELGKLANYVSNYSMNNSEKSIEIYQKALAASKKSSIPIPFKESAIYHNLYRCYKKLKKYDVAQDYLSKSISALNASEEFSLHILWSRSYAAKLPLFFEIDEEQSKTSKYKGQYQDSIKYYFQLLDKQISQNKIEENTYRNFMVYNINSLIKIGEYTKADKIIKDLEQHYKSVKSENPNTHCYTIALLNMSKYVLQRKTGTQKTYRAALENAYNHMNNCGKLIESYGVLYPNVLFHLYNDAINNKEYKRAISWQNIRKNYTNNKNNEKLKNITQIGEFWVNREKAQSEKILKLKQHEIQQARFILGITIFSIIGLILVYLITYNLYKKNKEQRIQLKKSFIDLEEFNNELIASKKEISRQKKDLEKNNIELQNKTKEIEALLRLNERSLFTKALIISTYKDAVNSIAENLSGIIKSSDLIKPNKLFSIEKQLLTITTEDEIWEDFKIEFEKTRPGFFDRLNKINSNLSVNDLKHAAYIISEMSAKEVANLLNVSPRSVETARYRLKKKLHLKTKEDLNYFLHSLLESKTSA